VALQGNDAIQQLELAIVLG